MGFEPVKDHLRAFWSYDQFPYLLSGTVTYMNERGDAKIAEYQNGVVAPVKIVPAEGGQALQEELTALKEQYGAARKQLDQQFEAKLDKLLKAWNVNRKR